MSSRYEQGWTAFEGQPGPGHRLAKRGAISVPMLPGSGQLRPMSSAEAELPFPVLPRSSRVRKCVLCHTADLL